MKKISGFLLVASGLLFSSSVSAQNILTHKIDSSHKKVDLSAEGSTDWIHWGYAATSIPCNRKAETEPQISDFETIGDKATKAYPDPPFYNWNNGSPVTLGYQVTNGVFREGYMGGFKIKVKASTQLRTLNLYIGSFAAQGKLTAFIEGDESASVSDVLEKGGIANYRVTYTFKSTSPGSHLVITWVQTDNDNFGNVTLQAATLSGVSIAKTPVKTSITSPVQNSFQEGRTGSVTLTSKVATKGNVEKVIYFANNSFIGESAKAPFTCSWKNIFPNRYEITAFAILKNGVVSPVSEPINYILKSGEEGMYEGEGKISAVFDTLANETTTDLTKEGTLDWALYGQIQGGSLFQNKKGECLISDVMKLGEQRRNAQVGGPVFFTWADGEITEKSATATTGGIWTYGDANGFEFTVPAGKKEKILKVYVCTWGGAVGKLAATLSDGSSPDYVDTSLSSNEFKAGQYTIRYKSKQDNELLRIRWTIFNKRRFGNLTLYGAALKDAE